MHREGSGPCSSFKLQPLKDANFTTDTDQELKDLIYTIVKVEDSDNFNMEQLENGH